MIKSVNLPAELWEKIDVRAAGEGRTRSAWLAWYVGRELAVDRKAAESEAMRTFEQGMEALFGGMCLAMGASAVRATQRLLEAGEALTDASVFKATFEEFEQEPALEKRIEQFGRMTGLVLPAPLSRPALPSPEPVEAKRSKPYKRGKLALDNS